MPYPKRESRMIACEHFRCVGCNTWKPKEAFHLKTGGGWAQITPRCRDCMKEERRAAQAPQPAPPKQPMNPSLRSLVVAAANDLKKIQTERQQAKVREITGSRIKS